MLVTITGTWELFFFYGGGGGGGGGGVKWAHHVAPLSRITKVETQYIYYFKYLGEMNGA